LKLIGLLTFQQVRDNLGVDGLILTPSLNATVQIFPVNS
jgi:hypothetical protein